MIPEGNWRARGVTAALGFTKDDNEQLGVELVFSPDQDEDVDGQHITWYGYFTEKTEASTLKALRTLGWSTDDLSDLTGIDANEVVAVVAHEEGMDGVTRARVRWINPVGGTGLAMKSKMSDDQARAFAERMRGKVLASAKAVPQPSAAPASSPAAAAARRAVAPAQTTTRATTRGRKAAAGGDAAAQAAADDDNIPF